MSLPLLHPNASRWTADRIGTILRPLLDDIAEPDPDAVQRPLDLLDGMSGVLHYGAFDIDRQADALVASWSTAQPVAYLRGLADAAVSAATVVGAAAGLLHPAVSELRSAQQQAASAIERANSAADWDTAGYLAPETPEGRLRTSVCAELVVAIQGAHQRVQSAIGSLAGVFRADPGADLVALPVPQAFAGRSPTPRVLDIHAANWDRLTADLGSGDLRREEFAAGVLRALKAAPDGMRADLLVYDSESFGGQGRASISLGELDTADHVAVLTPGITNAPGSMAGTVAPAVALKSTAEQLAPGESTATVLWFGYDIPLSWVNGGEWPTTWVTDTLAAADAGIAREGGDLLAADSRLIGELAAPAATLTLVGHSMGSVVTSEAARHPTSADNIVLMASPGVGYDATTAADYADVDAEQVFVLSFERDPITALQTDLLAGLIDGPTVQDTWLPQPFGPDPAGARFQAEVIDAPSNRPVSFAGDAFGFPMEQHGLPNYLSGIALTQVATVITGRTSQVKRRPSR